MVERKENWRKKETKPAEVLEKEMTINKKLRETKTTPDVKVAKNNEGFTPWLGVGEQLWWKVQDEHNILRGGGEGNTLPDLRILQNNRQNWRRSLNRKNQRHSEKTLNRNRT